MSGEIKRQETEAESFFRVEGLEKSFGGLKALDSPDVSIDEGEMVGMIGPNGAGKTTFFNCVSGVLKPDSGKVEFKGENVTRNSPHELARKGLVRTFQISRELETMTVAENLRLAAPNHPGEKSWHAVLRSRKSMEREHEVVKQAGELMEFFELDHLSDEYAGNLSGGQRKLLSISRALMLEPQLLMLDEPFAGINPTLTRKIVSHIERLNDDGMTIFIIEHEIETLAELVDRLIVLNRGRVLAEGKPQEVLQDERVIDAYLGE